MKRKQLEKEARRVAEGGEADRQSQNQGDNRTPDKPIGQARYTDNEGGGEQGKQGGSTRTTTLQSQGSGQGVMRDQRGQEQPADKKRAQQKSQTEGPAAYAPHQEDQDVRANPGKDPAKKKTGEF